jgi:hypothetical protein
MAVTYKLIETITVGSGGAASIAFSSIPQTYTDIVVLLSTRSASTGQQIICAVNGSTATSMRSLFSDGTVALSNSGATWLGFGNSSAETASVFGNMQIYFPNYAGSTNKSVSADSVMENNATGAYMALTATLFGTAAITSLTFTTNNGSFVQHSSASLYGIKNS